LQTCFPERAEEKLPAWIGDGEKLRITVFVFPFQAPKTKIDLLIITGGEKCGLFLMKCAEQLFVWKLLVFQVLFYHLQIILGAT
jgi:hypothetical protein